MLASLVLTEWWALFRNVHGNEPFEPKAVAAMVHRFHIASYLTGGVFATVVLAFRKQKKEAPHLQFALGDLVIDPALGRVCRVCLWVIATRMFLEPPNQFTLSRDCEAIGDSLE